MPGFVSHTVMAHDVYNNIDNKYVSLDSMLAYSLGGDLCKYAKCRYDSHHKDMDKFIYAMADYIKENDLTLNKDVMGLLYGHICHYVMDSVVHPLVKCVSRNCIRKKSNHTLIEMYYDNYLVNKICNTSRKKYLDKLNLFGSKDVDVNRTIDNVYLDIYDTEKVSKYYKFNLFLYRRLRRIYLLFSDKFINNVSGLNKLIKRNNINLCNDDNKLCYKDYLGIAENTDLLDLYDTSVTLAIEYIENINKYIKS